MIELCKTYVFSNWLSNLSDRRARGKIAARIDRLSLGNPGDVAPVGDGVSELRIDYGPRLLCLFHKTVERVRCAAVRRR